MQIGIYANYDRTNQTAGAVRLAGLAQSLAYSVSYLSAGRSDSELHPYWDGRVLKAKKENVRRWVNLSMTCVWFKPHLNRYRGVMEGCQSRRHVWVPGWHTLSEKDLGHAAYYDRIVCPSREMADNLADRLEARGTKLTRGIEHINWTSGVSPMRKTQVCRPDRLKVFVPVDNYTMHRFGRQMLATLDALLDALPHVDVTLATQRPGTRLARGRIEQMCRDYFGRFWHRCRLTSDEQLGRMHEHDWVWIPDVRSDNGLPAQQALAVGVPVIAWDISPLSEVIHDGWTGVLVPCNKTYNWLGAPTANWNGKELASALHVSLSSEYPLHTLRALDWPVGVAEDKFGRYWRDVLGQI